MRCSTFMAGLLVVRTCLVAATPDCITAPFAILMPSNEIPADKSHRNIRAIGVTADFACSGRRMSTRALFTCERCERDQRAAEYSGNEIVKYSQHCIASRFPRHFLLNKQWTSFYAFSSESWNGRLLFCFLEATSEFPERPQRDYPSDLAWISHGSRAEIGLSLGRDMSDESG